MHEPRYEPPPTLRTKLDAMTPRPRDFVLYCKRCAWVGETNAAHARSDVCPSCDSGGVRIWANTPKAAP